MRLLHICRAELARGTLCRKLPRDVLQELSTFGPAGGVDRAARPFHRRRRGYARPTATGLFPYGMSPELVDRMAPMNTPEHLGTPAEIADTVALPAGPHGGWIHGRVVHADGGTV